MKYINIIKYIAINKLQIPVYDERLPGNLDIINPAHLLIPIHQQIYEMPIKFPTKKLSSVEIFDTHHNNLIDY